MTDSPQQQIDALNASHATLFRQDIKAALANAQSAEALARQYPYPTGLVQALIHQMACYYGMSQLSDAVRIGNAARTMPETDPSQRAKIFRYLGIIYSQLGAKDKALEYQLQALDQYQALDDQDGIAFVYTTIGTLYSDMENSQKAIDYYQKSIAIYSGLDNKASLARVYNSCCVDYTLLGDYARARQYGEDAFRLFLFVEDDYGAGVASSSLGEVALAEQDYATAIVHFEAALEILKQRDPDHATAESLETQLNLARALYQHGRNADARPLFDRVLGFAKSHAMTRHEMQAHQCLASLHEAEGDLAQALDHTKQYMATRETLLNESTQRQIHHLQILHDTQQAQAESERLRQLREQDRQNFARLAQIKDEFLHSTTHDIKNPLSIINSLTFMLRMQLPPDTPKAVAFVDRIDRQVDKIRDLVQDMLELAKLEATPAIETESVQLKPWLEMLISGFSTLATRQNVSLEIAIQPDDLTWNISKIRLTKALENLISNAIKYSPDGGTVHLCASQDDNQLRLEIRDTGLGIPADAIPKLFTRFYRAEDVPDSIEGTGLGLSITKLAIEQHNGSIAVESEPGKGSTFRILIP